MDVNDLPTGLESERQAGLHHFALDLTRRRLSADRSPGAIARVVSKLHQTVDQGMALQNTCERCSVDPTPSALVSELIGIQGVLDGLDSKAQTKLKESCEAFLFKDDAHRSESGCPFQTVEGCLFGSARSLNCRRNGRNDSELVGIELGHAIGLCVSGLDHHRVNLAVAVPLMLDSPGWAEDYSRGAHVFWEAGRFPTHRDIALETARHLLGRQEPSGKPQDLSAALEALEESRDADLATAMARLPKTTVLNQLVRLRVPHAFSSLDEVEDARRNYLKDIREVAQSPLHPLEAFDALRYLDTFALAYQGQEVRSILTELCDTLIHPIVRRALPDLCQPIDHRKRAGKFRVGYLSSNMRYHNGAYWSLGWLRNHAEDVESYAFAINTTHDKGTSDFRTAADHFYYLSGDVTEAARFIKDLQLDVLIFTDLGMDGAPYQFAAMRLAPIQATAWGHPVTSGLATIDYYLSSDLMEPENGDEHYREKLVRLPGSGLFLYKRPPSDVEKNREDFGLPQGPLVIMPHNPIKVTIEDDDLFARVSDAVSVPIVFISGVAKAANPVIRARLEKAGTRMHWMDRLSPQEFRRVIELSDLILDVPSWNGGNVTAEAIALSKPMVTMPGKFMRGRHSLAFFKQANLQSLIASNVEEYVRIAVDRDLQARSMAEANLDGPFGDAETVKGLDSWIRKTVEKL